MITRIARLHKISLYAVIGVAFLCVVFGELLTFLSGGLFVGAVAASWWLSETDLVRGTNRLWWNGLVLAFLAYTVVQVVTTGEGYLKGGLRFILMLTAIKMLIRDGARDELQLYALSFLTIAAATTVNDGVTYGLFFGVYVLSGTFSLALFHLKEEFDHREAIPLTQRIPFDRRYMAVLAGISVVIFVSSIGIFFGFPRIGLGYFAQQSRSNTQVSGFSDSVELGSHGSVRTNPSVALRVEFPNGRPLNYRQLHWRTITFDRYDGSGWSRTFEDTDEKLMETGKTYALSSRLMSSKYLEKQSHRDIPEEVRIYAEPFGSDVVPTLWPSKRLTLQASDDPHMPGNPRTGDVEADDYGDISHDIASDIGISYTLTTYGRPDSQWLAQLDEDVPAHLDLEAYLQRPKGLSERIGELARRVTEEGDTPYRKAKAIESHLQNNYTYTTDLPEVDPDHPVEDFLFEFKRGHCEYYATAMVLMLRTLGIHARMVNGFLGGRWNRMGDFLAVRQADAHSWVEVYIPDYGWVQMDPTPAASPTLYQNQATVWLRDVYDAMRMQWTKWVLEYDLQSQIRLFKRLANYLVPRGLMDWGADGEASNSETSETSSGSVAWQPAVFWTGWLLMLLAGFLLSRRFDPRFRKLALVGIGLGAAGLSGGWALGFHVPQWGWGIAGALAGVTSVAAGALTHLLAATRGRADVSRLFDRIEAAGRRAETPRRAGETPGDYLTRLADQHPEIRSELERFRRRYLAARFGDRVLSADALAQLQRTVSTITNTLES